MVNPFTRVGRGQIIRSLHVNLLQEGVESVDAELAVANASIATKAEASDVAALELTTDGCQAQINALMDDIDALSDPPGSLPAVPDLFAHWDATSIVAVDGARLAGWTDEVSAISAAQATGAKQPAYSVAAINGKPGVAFSNARGDALVTGAVAPSSLGVTLLMVANGVNPVSGSYYPFGTNGTGVDVRAIYYNATPGIGLQGSPTLSASVNMTRPRLIAATFNGASSVIRVDGIQRTTGTTGAAASAPTIFTLGHRHSQAASNGFEGAIGEILYYDRVLTANEVATIETHLAAKWGIAITPQKIWHVDSVNGSASGNGRAASTALLTLSAAMADIKQVGATDASVVLYAPVTHPIRESATIDANSGTTIRLMSRTPGEAWHHYGSVKHTGGWTALGSGVYSKAMAISVTTLPWCYLPTLYDGDGQPLRIVTKNTATPTTPAAGEFGYDAGTYYLHLPNDANPNEHTVEVVHAQFGISVTNGTVLTVTDGDLRGAQISPISAGASSGAGTGAGTVYGWDTTSWFAGDSAWRTTQYVTYMRLERCLGWYAANDGFNHHCVAGGNAPLMDLIDCDGQWNDDEGVSPHDSTRLILRGGRYANNGHGGLTSVDTAITQVFDTEFDHNRRLDTTMTPGLTDIGGVSVLGNSILISRDIYVHDNPGPGVEIAPTATWTDNGGTRSGVENGNGYADEIGS